MMTEGELAEIEARHAHTTPSPWISIDEKRDGNVGDNFIQTGGEDIYLHGGATLGDQDFIAHAHQDIPRLIEEVRRLRAGHRPELGDELAAIEAWHAGAAAGEWKSWIEGRDMWGASSFIQRDHPQGEDLYLLGSTAEDQDFIAHAHQDTPRLIAEIRRLQAELSLRPA